jgi:hypothetical protein
VHAAKGKAAHEKVFSKWHTLTGVRGESLWRAGRAGSPLLAEAVFWRCCGSLQLVAKPARKATSRLRCRPGRTVGARAARRMSVPIFLVVLIVLQKIRRLGLAGLAVSAAARRKG